MKRFTFLFVLLFVSVTILRAQMNTGSMFISGNSNFGLNSYSEKEKDSNDDPDKYFNLNLNTRAGYFLKNRLAIGGLINLGSSIVKNSVSDSKTTTTNWMIGPMVRYYTEYGALIPFAEASVGLGMNTLRYEYQDLDPSESKHSVFGLKGGIGADYFLNESIAFEGMASYFMNRLKPKTEGATGEGHVQNGFEFTFGVIFYFGAI